MRPGGGGRGSAGARPSLRPLASIGRERQQSSGDTRRETANACPLVGSNGKVIGQGGSGTVSQNGAVRTVGQGDGVTFTGAGRLGGRSGSGTWRRSDGCGGTWSSAKQ